VTAVHGRDLIVCPSSLQIDRHAHRAAIEPCHGRDIRVGAREEPGHAPAQLHANCLAAEGIQRWGGRPAGLAPGRRRS